MKLRQTPAAVAHGSDLNRAVALYGGDEGQWLDLSSAVSPFSWAEEYSLNLPLSALHHLPNGDTEIADALKSYYGRTGLVTAGSQPAIRQLPYCFEHSSVWVLKGTYGEHFSAWKNAGHYVEEKAADEIKKLLIQPEQSCADILVVTNPGNPGGENFSAAELCIWAQHQASSPRWLIVDEAFMDATPENSLLLQPYCENIVVLRSLGKFFGMAGIRCGVVFASEAAEKILHAQLGPWAVSGPALWLLPKMLSDKNWQYLQCQRLLNASQQLLESCKTFNIYAKTPLFVTLKVTGPHLHQNLAQQKIWSRYFPQQALLRLGLPANENDWLRLDSALQSFAAD